MVTISKEIIWFLTLTSFKYLEQFQQEHWYNVEIKLIQPSNCYQSYSIFSCKLYPDIEIRLIPRWVLLNKMGVK